MGPNVWIVERVGLEGEYKGVLPSILAIGGSIMISEKFFRHGVFELHSGYRYYINS